MAISRYKKINIVKNNDADYKKVFNTRFGTNGLVQTTTTTFRTPSEDEILNIAYAAENWTLGQRLYKLAYKHYGNSSYWWLIALFNNISTEAELQFGQVIKVPIPLDVVLNLYGF
jgi:nucleoid-associated protein YgaU